jgi:hypothetical protein
MLDSFAAKQALVQQAGNTALVANAEKDEEKMRKAFTRIGSVNTINSRRGSQTTPPTSEPASLVTSRRGSITLSSAAAAAAAAVASRGTSRRASITDPL